MNNATASEMMLVRLDLFVPGFSALLVAAPTSEVNCLPLAEEIAAAARRLGRPARVVSLTPSRHTPNLAEPGVKRDDPSPQTDVRDAIAVETLRDGSVADAAIRAFAGVSVVAGRGVLDDAATLLAARAVDGVVVVAKVGKTLRADLVRTRHQVERAGGSIAGAIELH